MLRVLGLVDRLSTALASLTMIVFVGLVADMLYEVVSRRVFDSPTLWAYDIAYMSNGAIFMIAAGYTLLVDEHIRIDFLATRMRRPYQDAANALVYLCLLVPTLYFACNGALTEFWTAYATDELEPSSPWKPLIWPFYAAIALGICVFTLQVLAQAIRHAGAALGRWPSPLARKGEGM